MQRLLTVAALARAGIIWVALGARAMLLVVLTAIQTKRPLRLPRVGAQTPEGGARMRRRREIGGGRVEAGEQGFADLGRHVATVLTTAREAAEKEAAALLERARAQAAEIEADIAEKRTAAFAAAEDVRSRADAYEEKKRHEAEEAAAEVIARAEPQARELVRAAEERQRELEANVERTEERLRKLATGLRELAGRVDVLVGSDELIELVEPEREVEAPQPAGLDEALQRQVVQPAQVETGSNGQEA
jgi:vacuolar-type H+-ATPase subunit H